MEWLTFRQEGSTTALVLNSATQTLTFSMASADGNQNAITGSISSVPAAFVTDAKTLQAKFALTSQHSETQDSDGTRHDDSAWTLTIEPDTDGAEAADLVTFEPITAELSLQYSTESREGAPIQLRVIAGLHMAEADVGVKMALRTTSRWNALTLPTQGAEDVTRMDTMRAVQLLTTASDNLTRLIAGGSAPAATTAPELPTPEPNTTPVPSLTGE